MAPQVQGRKIAILGAGGNLGKPTIDNLLNKGAHTITAIQREGSSTSFPSQVIVKNGNLEDEAFLASVLKGQDALVLMPPLSHIVELQKPAVRAAAKAGVPYILPSEYGPDPFAETLTQENILLVTKKGIRDFIAELGVSSWISVAIGPWLDVSLDLGLWGIDAKNRKATIWNGANGRASTATLKHTGEAIGAVLSLPEAELAKYKNKAVYAPSWHLTQREILQAVQRATGTKAADWDVTERDVEDVAKDYAAGVKQGDMGALFTKFFVTHFMEGHGGDFESKVDQSKLAKLESLGLQKEGTAESAIKASLQ